MENDGHEDNAFRPYEERTSESYEPSQTQLSPEVPFNQEENGTTSTYCNISKPRMSVIRPVWMNTDNNAESICQQTDLESNSNQEYYNPIEDINKVQQNLPIKKRPLPPLDDESDDHDDEDNEVATINGFLPPKKRFR